jgi:hypothetical protein
MARITIEDYDPARHNNRMRYIDNAQAERHLRAPTMVPYKVCLVSVCGFTFEFHSLPQLRCCLDYYCREHHPSSRLPVDTGYYGGDHMETQRWFERLPQYLLAKSKRVRVVAALKRAAVEFGRVPGTETGTEPKPLYDWA